MTPSKVMPTRASSAPDLEIHLGDRQRPYYLSGETISGTVNRKSHTVAPRAVVDITLYGRSKANVRSGDYHGESSQRDLSRNGFNFFKSSTTRQILFDGPLHIEKGGDPACWPFAITIPRCVDRDEVASTGRPEASFIDLESADGSLPGTFLFNESRLSGGVSAYVEYYLDATLRAYSKNPGQEQYATLPITISTYDPDPPIADFKLEATRYDKGYRFASYRLVPRREDMKVSSSVRLMRLFNPTAVPCLAVKYEIDAPGVIQLEHPIRIPLFIRALPIWDRTSESIRGVTQMIKVESVHLEMASETNARVMGALNPDDGSGKEKVFLGSYGGSSGAEVYLPFSADDRPLDVGELMNLRLAYGGRIEGNSSGPNTFGRIYPDFTAYNIRHGGHVLHWCIRVSLAGEKNEISGSKALKILPPSGDDGPNGTTTEGAPPPFLAAERTESWDKPPPDMDPPPPFEDIMGGNGTIGESSRQMA